MNTHNLHNYFSITRVSIVDIGKIIEDSFKYSKEGLVEKWETWILLIISCIIFPLFIGYIMRICRGENPAPQLHSWTRMFTDGTRLFFVGLIYLVPVLILELVLFGSTGLVKDSSVSASEITGLVIAVLIGAILLVIVAIITWLILMTAGVRFARTGEIGEAFNFVAIFAHISKIGWMTYIIALLMMLISLVNLIIISAVFNVIIPCSGSILLFIMLPFIGLFSARYITLLYESAGIK